jgi:DNA-binding response OmpR family regulator
MRLLIVEDEKDLAKILQKGLQEEGYSVDLCFRWRRRVIYGPGGFL